MKAPTREVPADRAQWVFRYLWDKLPRPWNLQLPSATPPAPKLRKAVQAPPWFLFFLLVFHSSAGVVGVCAWGYV